VTSDKLRAAFLSFFEEKGHDIIPSSSLIPKGDPTMLLTTAGMVQIKPYFLGEAVPPNPRLASCQKCFRTTDIEEVGDPIHLTFFEMLGNFSVGDYFKQEAINWGWEFVTQRLGLSPPRLWVTIFLDDDESFRIWREIGVPEERILRFGEQDNFWGPAGDSGPCGPCSEIHYDAGEEFGCGKASCGPNCDCGRFSEIWNLVFTQYNQDKEGNRTPLPKPNIDTGMGLERTVAAIQGKASVYETDLFVPLLECLSGISGKKYGSDNDTDNCMRIIAEHSRGIAFLIGDGVIPSNEGRGYVLRRLLRRAVLFGRRLGLDRPFLAETAQTPIEQMKHVYPELEQRREFIIKAIEFEEARFSETLATGLELLDGIMEGLAGKKQNRISGKQAFKLGLAGKKQNRISGKQAFKLYDTYGFPVEITQEIAADRGFSIDLDGFEKEMERQRERARISRSVVIEVPTLNMAISTYAPTVIITNLKHESTIVNILINDKSVDKIQKGQEASLILSETPFYGEMGGQLGDTGEIHSKSGRFSVTNTVRAQPDIIVHRERRLDITRNHTATHLLQSALRQVLGEHVQQRGSLVAPHRLRFDFTHLTAMTAEEIREVEHIVNEKIRQNLKVYDEELPYKKAIEEGAIALFDEKYGDKVRVLKIGEPMISAELCGGTHVGSTGEIGFFHIISEGSIGAGLRRIEAVTGREAEAFIDQHFSDLEKIAQSLGASPEDVQDKVSGLIAELDEERKQRRTLESKLSEKIAGALLEQTEVVNGITVLTAEVPSSRPQVLREMSDLLRERLKSAVVVLGTIYDDKPMFLAAVTPDLVAKGYNAGEIVNQVAKATGGGGGGKAQFAQAGGKNKDRLDEALRLVKSLIQGVGR